MADSRGERYYICITGQILLACEGKRWYPVWVGQMEKWMGVGVGGHSYVLSDKWVFTCLQPPPHYNKSWHRFVTYDCISDCLRCDSILMARSACDGGIPEQAMEKWRCLQLRCNSLHDTISVTDSEAACVCWRGLDWGMCAAHVLLACRHYG